MTDSVVWERLGTNAVIGYHERPFRLPRPGDEGKHILTKCGGEGIDWPDLQSAAPPANLRWLEHGLLVGTKQPGGYSSMSPYP